MSDTENIFVAGADKPSQLVRLLVHRLGLEYMRGEGSQAPEDHGLRGPALTAAGLVGLRVYRNNFIDPDAAPDELQAFDAYPVQVDLWLPRPPAEGAQEVEARAWFDRLVAARPELPMLLVNELQLLHAAYLPGKPVHDFPAGTFVDFADIDAWLPWVIKTDAMAVWCPPRDGDRNLPRLPSPTGRRSRCGLNRPGTSLRGSNGLLRVRFRAAIRDVQQALQQSAAQLEHRGAEQNDRHRRRPGPAAPGLVLLRSLQARPGPRDADLGVAGASLSPRLASMTARTAAAVPFAKAASLLGEPAGIELTVKRAERSATASGRNGPGRPGRRGELQAHGRAPEGPDMLYIIAVDATGVPLVAREAEGRKEKVGDGKAPHP
jgi:hypothetical protein